MPAAPPRRCPRCRQSIHGRCPTCTPAHRTTTDQARGNSNSRGYDSHWRRVIRPAFLRANPICVLCGTLATVPDHWPTTRAQLVADGAPDPDAEHRLRPLCTDCHNLYGLSYKPWIAGHVRGQGGSNL
jgi:5-methylcytosine-specific restriction enzyme A